MHSWSIRIALAPAFVVGASVVFLIFVARGDATKTSRAKLSESSRDESTPSTWTSWFSNESPTARANGNVVQVPVQLDPDAPLASMTNERPPWESTPENTTPPSAHHIPAWQIMPPKPAPFTPPMAPVPPPNPATHTPPKENPGGVDGELPTRPTPGLADR